MAANDLSYSSALIPTSPEAEKARRTKKVNNRVSILRLASRRLPQSRVPCVKLASEADRLDLHTQPRAPILRSYSYYSLKVCALFLREKRTRLILICWALFLLYRRLFRLFPQDCSHCSPSSLFTSQQALFH